MITLTTAAINIGVAMGCGSLIGMERQIRQRKAGVRTNALVALGAAAYMVFSMLIEGDMSPSRVAAQVVSGIGFLGAGIIFRDGFNIHGLTTAATLWCSAAVGLLAGAGHWDFALMTTGMVVFVNFGLRPLVQWMKRRINTKSAEGRHYRINLSLPDQHEAEGRALVLRTLATSGLHLSDLLVRRQGEGIVQLMIDVAGEGVLPVAVEQAVRNLALEPYVAQLHWEIVDEP